jgi:hypothetical protein
MARLLVEAVTREPTVGCHVFGLQVRTLEERSPTVIHQGQTIFQLVTGV